MKRVIFLLLISLLILAGCGGKDDDDKSSGGLEGVADDNTPTTVNTASNEDNGDNSGEGTAGESVIANIPAPEANIFEMPAVDGLEGRLLFVQGNTTAPNPRDGDAGRLFLANFDGTQPQMLVPRVYTTSVNLSPDKTKVFYAAIDGRSWYGYLLDLETLESTQLLHLQSQFGGVSSWSPDGQWLTILNPPPVGSGQHLVRVDGSSTFALGNGGVIWTQDNQLIFTNFVGNIVEGVSAISFEVIDPTTQERTPLDLPINADDIPNLAGNVFYEVLANEGYDLTSNYTATSPNGGSTLLPDNTTFLNVQTPPIGSTGAPPLCGDFQLTEFTPDTEDGNTIYEVTDTLAITDIQYQDNGYFLERWYLNDCNYGLDNLNVALEYVTPDAEPQVITDNLYPGTDLNPTFIRVNQGSKYTISPDGRYVIWIDGSFATVTTTLKITDLVTNETADLMTWTSSSTNNFVIFDAFTTVLWVE